MILTALVIGEIGAGKSSLINLLANTPDLAKVSGDAAPCTKTFKLYEIDFDFAKIHIYDTAGFNNAEKNSASPRLPFENACELVQSLRERVDLLILCTQAKRLTHHTHLIYRLFYETFFDKTVPIVMVITGREAEGPTIDSMNKWWSRNQLDVESKLDLLGHACITTICDSGDNLKYWQSFTVVEGLLEMAVSRRRGSVQAHAPDFPLDARLSSARDIISGWSLPSTDAKIIERQTRRLVLRMTNIVVFGETGVGKSSVVNLIAGKDLARVDDGARGCTMESKEYRVTIDHTHFRIFDTVGLNVPEVQGDEYLASLVKAYELVDTLERAGGVDVLLFCIRIGRITKTTQSNYKLYHDFLCGTKVPLLIVITHAEGHRDVDNWWNTNKHLFKEFGINCSEHIFVTASDLPEHAVKRLESSESLLRHIERLHISPSVGLFVLNADQWFTMFWKKIGELVAGKQSHPKKVIADILIRNFNISKERALRVAENIAFR